MATISKVEKPKIYTESDQILNDLKEELAHLKKRMILIEEEQEFNRSQLENLMLSQEFANELISSQQEEIKISKENFNVIADVVHDLKSPVSDVVHNLADIIPSIDDKDAQETLRDCMNTATYVLNSFDKVEDFCSEAGRDHHANQQAVDIKDFFRRLLVEVQADIKDQHFIQMFIDKGIPSRNPLYIETIKICLSGLVNEIVNRAIPSNIKITVATEESGEKYGIVISDLAILIETDQSTDLKWQNSLVHAIQSNQKKLLDSGLNLLKIRDHLRKTGGQLNIIENQGMLKGFKFNIPLTY